MNKAQSLAVILAAFSVQCLPSAIAGDIANHGAEAPKYEIRTKALTVDLSADGRIVGGQMNGHQALLNGQTTIVGCVPDGPVTVQKEDSGGFQFTHPLRSGASNKVLTLVESFKPTADSVRWEVEIDSSGGPWSANIVTELTCPVTESTRFWTAWSDPDHQGAWGAWRDPLVLKPFSQTTWSYANMSPTDQTTGGDYISIPLATVAQTADGTGLSLVLSPECTFLDTYLSTSKDGTMRFNRGRHRLGTGKPLRFDMDIVPHEADWRGGLRWMTARYPQYFDPAIPKADQIAGCGAYSGDDDPVDAARLKKMAFSINWKLCDDDPYFGMYIPPVRDADETWVRSGDEPAAPTKSRLMSCRKMNNYAIWMKQNGFHVLDYFDVTEFGKNMGGPVKPTASVNDPNLWKDPMAFLELTMPHATIEPRTLSAYNTWVTDCGDPAYQAFLLEQARRDIQFLPDSDGICIDRMDWMRGWNMGADDGVSWSDGKPVRSLSVSWKSLMEKLGPLMHHANKVVFGNPLTGRLDLMREVDGFYCEYGESGAGLNSMAMLGVRKTAISWTDIGFSYLAQDPDAYFQRDLYMGVYPTAPYPYNNHCINPSIKPIPEKEAQFLAYGPLLDAMRGKKWVLAPHCVEVANNAAKANLFQVPGGYSMPVVFAGKAEYVDVAVRNISFAGISKCSALQPGVDAPLPVSAKFKNGVLTLHVPIHRGCAMVLLRS